MARTIDLQRFCGQTQRLSSPWNLDGWRYATDGHICVRAPTNEADDDVTARPNVRILPWPECRLARKPLPPPNPDRVPVRCEDCDGTGQTVCHQSNCSRCGGTGKDGTQPGPVVMPGRPRNGLLAGRLHGLISSLPGVRWRHTHTLHMFAFRFTGGEGMVMGMEQYELGKDAFHGKEA